MSLCLCSHWHCQRCIIISKNRPHWFILFETYPEEARCLLLESIVERAVFQPCGSLQSPTPNHLIPNTIGYYQLIIINAILLSFSSIFTSLVFNLHPLLPSWFCSSWFCWYVSPPIALQLFLRLDSWFVVRVVWIRRVAGVNLVDVVSCWRGSFFHL